MRTAQLTMVAIAVAGSLPLLATPARAQEYPWCSYQRSCVMDCSFSSEEQCKISAAGIGGCVQNPRANATIFRSQKPRRQ